MSKADDGGGLILALDASTTKVGWAVGTVRGVGEYGPVVLAVGLFKPKGADVWERIWDYERWLGDILVSRGYGVVAYERATGNHGHMRTNLLLGAVEAITRRCLRPWPGVELVTVVASQTKAKANQAKAAQMAELWPGEVFGQDELDAIAIWWQAVKMLERGRQEKLGAGGSN